MKLSELSAVSGVPAPTIKFYLRSGLLARGHGGGVASYDQTHVDRLHLVRTLTDLGGLSLERVAAVVTAIDAGNTPDALDALPPPLEQDQSLPLEEVETFLAGAGLRGTPGPATRAIARALLDLRRAGLDVDATVFRPHARAAAWLVSEEADAAGDATAAAVVATTAFGAALGALRVAAVAGRR